MKMFFSKGFVFGMVVLVFLLIYIESFRINTLDFYYNKITGDQYSSLVIGNSKPALIPFNDGLPK